MQKVKFIAVKTGEYAGTSSDILIRFLRETPEAFVGVDENLYSKSAQWKGIRSYDDWYPVEAPLYSIVVVEIPHGLHPDFFLQERFAFEGIWGDVPKSKELPHELQERLVSCVNSFFARTAIARLAVTAHGRGFRSQFKKSLWEQVEAWLSTPLNERKHSMPLSPKQLQAIL